MFIRLRQLLRRGRGQEGAAAVEFAVVLPLLILILAVLTDFGWLFYWQHTVTNASRAGARYAVQAHYTGNTQTYYSDADIKAVVDKYGAGLNVVVDRSAGDAAGAPRSVEVTKTMQWFFLGFLQSGVATKGMSIPLPASVHTKTWMTME